MYMNVGNTLARKIKKKRLSLRKIDSNSFGRYKVCLQIIFLEFMGLSCIPPAETVTDDYPSPEYKWWVEELGLQETEKVHYWQRRKAQQCTHASSTIFYKQFLTYRRCYQQYLSRSYTKCTGPWVDIFRFTSLKTTGWCLISMKIQSTYITVSTPPLFHPTYANSIP